MNLDSQEPAIDSLKQALDTMPQSFILHDSFSYYPMGNLNYVHMVGFRDGYILAMKDYRKDIRNTDILYELVQGLEYAGLDDHESIKDSVEKARAALARATNGGGHE